MQPEQDQQKYTPEGFRIPSVERIALILPLTIGGKIGEQLLAELKKSERVNIDERARIIVESSRFTVLPEPQQRGIGIMAVSDLVPNPKGSSASIEEIELARDKLGFEPVSDDTAIQLLLQRGSEFFFHGMTFFMSMKIQDDRGRPFLFRVGVDEEHDFSKLLLSVYPAMPPIPCFPNYRFPVLIPQKNKT